MLNLSKCNVIMNKNICKAIVNWLIISRVSSFGCKVAEIMKDCQHQNIILFFSLGKALLYAVLFPFIIKDNFELSFKMHICSLVS